MSSARSFTFTSYAIDVTQLIAAATVTLIGAKHVGALLTARVVLTLVQIYTEERLKDHPMCAKLRVSAS